MFLAVTTREVQVEPAVVAVEGVEAVEAVEEVLEVVDAETEEVLVAFVEAVAGVEGVDAVAAKDAVVETQVSQVSIEDDADSVAQNLAAGRNVKYYKINAKPASCTIKPVTLKVDRQPAPAQEVVEVEAGGVVVGSTVVDA